MVKKISKLFYYLFKYPVYKLLLGKIGSRSRLVSPMISGHKRIFIGSNVFIHYKSWLAADPVTGVADCKLIIGDGTYIGHFCHIYASAHIEIGSKVLIADKVYLSDNRHSYKDAQLAVIDQPVKQLKPVIIGDGAWLGENVCIIGARVGKKSVVGANAVVTKDIPDYTIAVGAPAYIIKRFNFDTNEWQKTDKDGSFI
jgi:acetyltransferase-like isoleucine patch superfamily enzyme